MTSNYPPGVTGNEPEIVGGDDDEPGELAPKVNDGWHITIPFPWCAPYGPTRLEWREGSDSVDLVLFDNHSVIAALPWDEFISAVTRLAAMRERVQRGEKPL